MKCLCCGKILKEPISGEERESGWHRRCIRSFFDTKFMPVFDVTEEQLEQLARDAVNKGLTVPGVQKKLSLHLTEDGAPRLTIVDYPTGYILKPQTEEFSSLPEAEDLCMHLAEKAGIRTVPHALVKMNAEDETYAYITKRIDRSHSRNHDPMEMYAMEDFCQLSYRLTQDKYRGSYEKCAKIIQRYSEKPGLDLSELFLRIIFSFVTGNSDMHLKNFSLIEMKPGERRFVLAEAYDLLPVNVIMPEDKEEFALSLNGKKRNIRKKDFLIFAENCAIPRKSAENMMKKLAGMEADFIKACDESWMPVEMQESMKQLIQERMEVLRT